MPTSWNNLEDFQDIIYRQIEESECVSQTASDYKDNSICYNSIFLNLILLSRLNQIMSKTQSSEDSPARNATLKMYFDKIATVLKEKVRKWHPQQCSLCSFGHIEFVLITIMSLSRNPVIVRGRWFERRYYTHSNLFSRAPTTLFSQEAMWKQIYLFVCLSIYLFNYVFIYWIMYLFIYLDANFVQCIFIFIQHFFQNFEDFFLRCRHSK